MSSPHLCGGAKGQSRPIHPVKRIAQLGWQMTRVTKRLQVYVRKIAFDHAGALPLHRIHHYKSGGMSSLLREDAGSTSELQFTGNVK